ncbi:hypothetical protein GCM10023334_116170 [Nonomuraea thailandensis]
MHALFGKRPTEKDPAKGTSPAVDFTRRAGRGNPPGVITAGRPGPTQHSAPGRQPSLLDTGTDKSLEVIERPVHDVELSRR